MASPLSDLDELVLKCRDQNAKDYIRDAVACYKVGAFRSSIVATWIAVSFDIIDKLKELSLAGDKEAEKQIDEFDNARRKGDIVHSLKFEREILIVCRDKMELISPIEFIDLTRLQEDRNRCAHPSMTTDSEIFKPSAELARMHIRSAVEHLLQYPPAQGKYALDGLVLEVESEYFPTDVSKAVIAFENSPLRKARASLIRNFILVLIKMLLNNANSYKKTSRLTTALNAIATLYSEHYSNTLREKLSKIVRALDAKNLHQVTLLIKGVNDSWQYFDKDVKQRFELYVENLQVDKFEDVEVYLSIDDLKYSAEKRIKQATRNELADALFFDIPEQVSNRIVELYSQSNNYDQANLFASTVITYAGDYNKEQVHGIIKACGENEQIKYSFECGKVINALRKNKNVSDDVVDEWLSASDLKEFLKKKESDSGVASE